jgi:DNA-binding response OmpR family regulator
MLGRKILVLESDQAVAFPLAAALRKSGWIVISAPDAVAAMSVARKQKPDAVLLNSRLAGGGGLVALKRLRSSAYTTSIPIICIVSANSRESEELVAAGVQETIDPPGDPQAIDAALQRYLGRPKELVRVPAAVLGAPERINALTQSKLLDTPAEESFDPACPPADRRASGGRRGRSRRRAGSRRRS